MKRATIIIATLLSAVTAGAQTINIHKADGTVEAYPSSEVDYIDFTAEESFLTCPDDNHPHAIDLGLPSGTKWACCNVGASTPEGYGDHYAWGETQPKSVYNWETYAYWHDNDSDGDVDSNEIENIGPDIAGTACDTATANWGSPWRMPSKDQIQELQDNCTLEWMTQDGVHGCKFTSNKNGNSIFLPAAGHRRDGELNYADTFGYYWSSEPLKTNPYYYACDQVIESAGASIPAGRSLSSSLNRTYGLSVRPVR